MRLVYDNWQRLVEATLKREQFRQIALASSSETSFSSSAYSSYDVSSSHYDLDFTSSLRRNVTNFAEISGKPIKLADQVVNAADRATLFKKECMELKSKTEKLALLLHQADLMMRNNLYDRPMIWIMENTIRVLEKALALVLKCSYVSLFVFVRNTALHKVLIEIESSIANVSWLLNLSGNEFRGIPPIAMDNAYVYFIWEQISVLYTGSLDDRCEAAASLVSLARDRSTYLSLIASEGGFRPVLKLLEEGNVEGQENAARFIGIMGKSPQFIKHMMEEGTCNVLVRILNDGPIRSQAAAARSVSELVEHSFEWDDIFIQVGIIPLLVRHLSLEVSQEEQYSRYMVAMATRALCHLAKNDNSICQNIKESSALLCLAVLLDDDRDEHVRYNSAVALKNITTVGEEYPSVSGLFEPKLPACKKLVDQLLRVIEIEAYSELAVPCIKAIGNLARIYQAAKSTRPISPLVELLNNRKIEVCKEACISLTKFATINNFHLVYSKAIIGKKAAKYLVRLVVDTTQSVSSPVVQNYPSITTQNAQIPAFVYRVGNNTQIAQIPAFILLCILALNVPESEELATPLVVSFLRSELEELSFEGGEVVVKRLLAKAEAELELHGFK